MKTEKKLQHERQVNVHSPQIDTEEVHSQKGTFVSVMFIGAFIGLLWLGIWGLFMSRF